jgi:NhaP-type Na+/H+ or K+/H+ antiporter
VGLFLSLTLGGILLGSIFGAIASFWLKKINNDEILTVNITFFTCYLLYFTAENINLGIKVDGIMALVGLGVFMAIFGKTKIGKDVEHAVHTFWKFIIYAAESIIFLLAGILVGVKVLYE